MYYFWLNIPKKTKNPNPSPIGNRFGFFLFGGPGGIRTLDLSDANRTLSQLSYRPICKAGRPVFSMTNVLRLPYYTAFWRDCQADFSGFLRMFCARLPLPAFGRAQSRRVSVCWHGGFALLCVSEKIRGGIACWGNFAFTARPCGSGPCRRRDRR